MTSSSGRRVRRNVMAMVFLAPKHNLALFHYFTFRYMPRFSTPEKMCQTVMREIIGKMKAFDVTPLNFCIHKDHAPKTTTDVFESPTMPQWWTG